LEIEEKEEYVNFETPEWMTINEPKQTTIEEFF
jgi:hypothetical protein